MKKKIDTELKKLDKEVSRWLKKEQKEGEELGEQLVCGWSRAIPFGTRPEQVFGLHPLFYGSKEQRLEFRRRVYLICEWYKCWPGPVDEKGENKLDTPRAKALEIRLREFSRTDNLIE